MADPATLPGYKATHTDTALVVHGVEIFCTCFREPPDHPDVTFDGNFDDRWIRSAVKHAKQAEGDRYFPPLFIRHHDMAAEMNDAVRAAGYFKILGTRPISFKGKRVSAVVADLVFTDPGAQSEALAGRVPYRSVEIFNVDKPAFDGLALLDHEPPFLELPMMVISEVNDQRSTGAKTAPAGFSLGGFNSERRAQMMFREETPMTTKNDEEEAKAALQGQLFEKEEEAGEDAEGSPSATLDVSSVVKAIESGEISVKDMDAILDAIQGQKGAGDEEPAAETEPAAGAEAMSKSDEPAMTAETAALQGRIEGLEAKDKQRDESDTRREDVAVAMKRLEGHPAGDLEKLEAKFVAFHTRAGGDADLFGSYVDAMVKAIGPVVRDSGAGDRFARQQNGAPPSEVAMKFQAEGPAALEKATAFSSEWRSLKASGHTRMTEERYVSLRMERQNLAAQN